MKMVERRLKAVEKGARRWGPGSWGGTIPAWRLSQGMECSGLAALRCGLPLEPKSSAAVVAWPWGELPELGQRGRSGLPRAPQELLLRWFAQAKPMEGRLKEQIKGGLEGPTDGRVKGSFPWAKQMRTRVVTRHPAPLV